MGVGADGTAAYRLTHDTLAPLLRQRFRVSPALAQRARHVLEGRVATWKAQPTDPVLDRVDLASVEEGLPWMRALEKGEPELLESSRQAEKRRVADEEERRKQLRDAEERRQRETVRRLRATLIGLSVSLTLLGVAGWGWRTAWVREEQTNEKARIAESRGWPRCPIPCGTSDWTGHSS